jgi:hypothetical protein
MYRTNNSRRPFWAIISILFLALFLAGFAGHLLSIHQVHTVSELACVIHGGIVGVELASLDHSNAIVEKQIGFLNPSEIHPGKEIPHPPRA